MTHTTYHYTECGLDNVWLVNGYKERKTPYGAAVAVEKVDLLHKTIAMTLVEKPSRLTGKEFRFLRTACGLSQKGVATMVSTDEDGVGRWERGVSKVPGGVDLLIRAFYREKVSGNAQIDQLVKTLAEIDTLEIANAKIRLQYDKNHRDWMMAA